MSLRYFTRFKAAFFILLLGASIHEANAVELRRTEFSLFRQANCSGIASCSVSFGPVPGHQKWLIKYVSCYTSVGNPNGRILYWYLYANNANSDRVGEIHLRPASLGTTTTDHTYNANEQASLLVPQHSAVGVAMTRDSSTAGDTPFLLCTIGGDLIVLQ